MKNLTIEIIKDEEFGGFTARLPDVSVYGEGDTPEDAIADLKTGLKTYVEIYGIDDVMSRLVSPVEFRKVNLKDLALA